MIRKDREITDLDIQLDILRQAHVCRLAFNDPEMGVPYIVPMNYGVMRRNNEWILTFHCAPRGRKLELIAADSRCSFEAECDVKLVYNPAYGHNTDIYRSVIGYGHAEMVTDPAQKHAMLQNLVDRYHKAPLEVTETDVRRCTIFCVVIHSMTGKEKKVAPSYHPTL